MYTEQYVREQLTKQKYSEEAIALILKVFPYWGTTDFDGQNCDDIGEDWNDGVPCAGWDGLDNRCACGNRRVSWEILDGVAYAVAH